jgi:hypothetical protein
MTSVRYIQLLGRCGSRLVPTCGPFHSFPPSSRSRPHKIRPVGRKAGQPGSNARFQPSFHLSSSHTLCLPTVRVAFVRHELRGGSTILATLHAAASIHFISTHGPTIMHAGSGCSRCVNLIGLQADVYAKQTFSLRSGSSGDVPGEAINWLQQLEHAVLLLFLKALLIRQLER